MLVATFNVNGVVKRLDNLLAWLAERQPDVVCLQELKCEDGAFPAAALEVAGYGAVWQGQRTWNGVGILARGAAPILTRDRLPGDDADTTARYIEAAVSGVLVGCLYLPNGNPAPGPKFEAKMAWFARLAAHATALQAEAVPVVLAGDYNVAPTPLDVYPTRSYDDNALVQPAPRAAFGDLVAAGWTDAVRARHPGKRLYTFWDYRRDRFARDAGMRLDHLLVTPDLARRLVEVGVDREVRGREGASDHAPVWARLAPRQA